MLLKLLGTNFTNAIQKAYFSRYHTVLEADHIKFIINHDKALTFYMIAFSSVVESKCEDHLKLRHWPSPSTPLEKWTLSSPPKKCDTALPSLRPLWVFPVSKCLESLFYTFGKMRKLRRLLIFGTFPTSEKMRRCP
ncbi:hypothetical protein O6H91_12G012600 [Diphasiastrum complanatum]|uniref:Uncharacterized protein n=1 Tax=Diphasiastrum complanatum TaxID=34168 RepID=A0ACC2C023_DIPCM|nr:hypothetical protein O6H91_12G012600 [Diphasiastrum complanatum]